MFDFRSDTATVPTGAMRLAMARADVGDGDEDPTVARLEATVAALLGKEAALFCATGTFANVLAMRLHIGPLTEVLCDARAHIATWENGQVGAFAGGSLRALLPATARFVGAEQLAAAIRTSSMRSHVATTALCSFENTLNGAVHPAAALAAAATVASERNIATHLDGARLWNAAVAHDADASGGASSGAGALVRLAGMAAPFDTVSVCLSKGLGAPVGSLLLGSAAQIKRAHHFRKLHGGHWRQAGFLAAAGLHALSAEADHVGRLAQDHTNAAVLAEGLDALGFTVVQPVETNMVWCAAPSDVRESYGELQQRLAAEGFAIAGVFAQGANPFGPSYGDTRFATHLGTPRAAIDGLLQALHKLLPVVRKLR